MRLCNIKKYINRLFYISSAYCCTPVHPLVPYSFIEKTLTIWEFKNAWLQIFGLHSSNPAVGDTVSFLSIAFHISLDHSLKRISSRCWFPLFTYSSEVPYKLQIFPIFIILIIQGLMWWVYTLSNSQKNVAIIDFCPHFFLANYFFSIFSNLLILE